MATATVELQRNWLTNVYCSISDKAFRPAYKHFKELVDFTTHLSRW